MDGNEEYNKNNYERRPLDDVIEAGPPVNPLRFPQPIYHPGRRVARVLVYSDISGEYIEAENVLFRVFGGHDDDSALQKVEIAYWKIPQKKRIKTLLGYIDICHILRRCQDERSSDDDDSSDNDDTSEEEEITFQLTPEVVAVKAHSWELVRKWNGRHAENPLNEISAMQLLGANHPNVLGCHEVLFDGEYMNVVMPYCTSGDLLQLISSHKIKRPKFHGFQENEARYWFKQLLEGISHFQKNGICHRDLSPENIVIDEQTRSLIIDMGMCIRIPFSDPMSNELHKLTDAQHGTKRRLILPQVQCGKLRYMCPEIYCNQEPFDGFAADMWTAGTILLFMLTGTAYKQPFDPYFKCVTRDLPRLLREFKISISPLACHLIQNLLLVDHRMRLTLEEAMEHSWFEET